MDLVLDIVVVSLLLLLFVLIEESVSRYHLASGLLSVLFLSHLRLRASDEDDDFDLCEEVDRCSAALL